MIEVKTYRKKPVEIQSVQLTEENGAEVAQWASAQYVNEPNGFDHAVHIATLEGTMTAFPGDWIIRGVQGEFYPCKPEIFEKTYDPVS